MKIKIMYGGTGKGKSYSPFFLRHNLMGKTNDELKIRLAEIIADQSLQQSEIEQAKIILQNLET